LLFDQVEPPVPEIMDDSLSVKNNSNHAVYSSLPSLLGEDQANVIAVRNTIAEIEELLEA
jgi:hypothetical protein